MNWWQRLRRRERLEDELDAEIQFHVEQLVADLRREGLSEREARRQASREFGQVQEIKDDCRRARGTEWLVDLFTDARIGLRILRKERAFSMAAIGALSLGLGVSAVFFSLVYASCFAPLPFPGVKRLVDVSLRDDSGRQPSLTLAQARVIAAGSPVGGVGYFTRRTLPVRTRDSSARRASVAYVSEQALPLIGVGPSAGRGFAPDEYPNATARPPSCRRGSQRIRSAVRTTHSDVNCLSIPFRPLSSASSGIRPFPTGRMSGSRCPRSRSLPPNPHCRCSRP